MIPSINPEMELDENMAEALRNKGLSSRLEIYQARYQGYTKDDLLRVLINQADLIVILENSLSDLKGY